MSSPILQESNIVVAVLENMNYPIESKSRTVRCRFWDEIPSGIAQYEPRTIEDWTDLPT